jgi:hypothetical protein
VGLWTPEGIRDELTAAFRERRIVTAGIGAAFPWEETDPTGLPTSHAYSVIGWDAASERITLRNPWGAGERRDVADGATDGVFEVTLGEFTRFFDTFACEAAPGGPPRLDPGPGPDLLHEVARGETLSGIADRYYGIMRLYEDLVTANWPMDADRIEVGQVLHIPRLPEPRISVAAGDTLERIALYWYGDPDRSGEILLANQDVLPDPSHLPEGQSIVIPMTGAELEPLGA